MRKKGFIGAIVLAIIIFGGLILTLTCTERIPAGYVGVVYNMNGGVDGEVLTQGWHIVAPTKKVTTYSIGIEQSYLTAEDKGDSPKDESFSIPTSDGKTVRVNFDTIAQRYQDAGYQLPRMVFWNVNSRTGTIPVKENDLGVALVSGFSPNIAKMVMSGKLDPYECLLETLNTERYQPVEDAMRSLA